MTVAIVLAALAAYAAIGLHVARRTFGRKRPLTEPLNCEYNYSHRTGDRHSETCYRQPGTLIDSAAGAAGCAVTYGAGWPVTLTCLAVAAMLGWLAARWSVPTEAERQASIDRLERDTGIKP